MNSKTSSAPAAPASPRLRYRPRWAALLSLAAIVAAGAVPSGLQAAATADRTPSPTPAAGPAPIAAPERVRALRPNEGAIVTATGSMARTAAKVRKATNADAINLKRRLAKDAALRRTLAMLRSAANKPGTLASSIVVGGSVADIPGVAVAAYQAAAFRADVSNPGCDIQWTLVAGIGRVESDHGSNGGSAIAANGVVRPAILGPVLDGSGGDAAIPDTDRGRYDGDKVWDRAVGPMQFIPSTWATSGRDGNGDGVADPENIFDAALASADYLCASGGDLNTPEGAENAVLSYNHSLDYVLVVLGYSSAYGGQDLTPVSAEIAAYLEALAKAAQQAPKHPARKPVRKTHTPVARPTTAPSPKPPVTPTPSAKPTMTPRPTPKPTIKPTPSPAPAPTPSPSATSTPSASTSPADPETPDPTATAP